MKKKNKKGFTLVELLAVIVILIIIILLAVNIIKNYTLEAKKKSIMANSISYVKAINSLVVELRGTENAIMTGSFTVDELNDLGIKISGTKPDNGNVFIYNSSLYFGCFEYEDYYIEYNNGVYSDPLDGKCSISFGSAKYNYTGHEEIYTATIDGTYKIEVWGAQGGPGNNVEGGYGAYSTIIVDLDKDDKLYINVGGKGLGTSGHYDSIGAGGYNGGGNGCNGANDRYAGGGGGATSVALESGLLSTFSTKPDKLLVVAGGGGGSWYYASGYTTTAKGHAGGFTSNGCASTRNSAKGATQSTGYAFGQAENVTCRQERSGAGGGYYSGYSVDFCASGGSGFINTTLGTDAKMVCYECQESADEATYTESVSCVSETPTEECAKLSHGYAKISLLEINKK